MPPKIDLGVVKAGLGVLMSIADAVPVMGAPFKGSFEALKQIIEYTEVSVTSRLTYSKLMDSSASKLQ
jgi:hypothetical protein